VWSRKHGERAWEKVKKNRGRAGIDEVPSAVFELRKGDYWALWHRKLRDGPSRPHPVKRVERPKADGGGRQLGIPTVLDRVCQQALVQRLAPIFEPQMRACSFG
jgi:RNA-directed DNA polymerase